MAIQKIVNGKVEINTSDCWQTKKISEKDFNDIYKKEVYKILRTAKNTK